MNSFLLSLCACLVLSCSASAQKPELTLDQLGSKFLYEVDEYHTDPGLAIRNRPEFIAKHGFRAERLVEALGNGQYLNYKMGLQYHPYARHINQPYGDYNPYNYINYNYYKR